MDFQERFASESSAGRWSRPEREPLKREVAVDEFYLGGYEEGLSGGPSARQERALRSRSPVRGRGSRRLRLAVLKSASTESLGSFVGATTEPGAVVNTDGWGGYNGLDGLGYEHRPHNQSAAAAPGEESYLPRAHARSRI